MIFTVAGPTGSVLVTHQGYTYPWCGGRPRPAQFQPLAWLDATPGRGMKVQRTPVVDVHHCRRRTEVFIDLGGAEIAVPVATWDAADPVRPDLSFDPAAARGFYREHGRACEVAVRPETGVTVRFVRTRGHRPVLWNEYYNVELRDLCATAGHRRGAQERARQRAIAAYKAAVAAELPAEAVAAAVAAAAIGADWF